MTLRESTGRPETITMGTKELVETNPESLKPFFETLFAGKWKKGQTRYYGMVKPVKES